MTMATLFALQFALIHRADYSIYWYMCTSTKLGPSVMRNGSISFAQCVKPGGRPTSDHCLSIYNFPGWMTAALSSSVILLLLCINPILAIIRIFYPEHSEGVNRGRYFDLFWLFLRHPLAVQGEGPSNGDGLSAMCGSESLIYPVTPKRLQQGPLHSDYWLIEGKPRLRDMFHDKLFCHRFFESFGAKHPILVAEVCDQKVRERFVTPENAPAKMIWKPRYSTMSLGVEHFTGWDSKDWDGEWAPSRDPYVIEEFICATEFPQAAEWYRMPTIWEYDTDSPKMSYIWRTRNKPEDKRVQTDIIGGAYCIPRKTAAPFVGPADQGKVYDPREKIFSPIDPKVDVALQKAIKVAIKMHKCLGKELFSIGWDFIIREDEPVFIEFNINNGFYVADHSIEEVYQMINWYEKQFLVRVGPQLLNFDPLAHDRETKYVD